MMRRTSRYLESMSQRIPAVHCPHCGGKLTRSFVTEATGRIISRLRVTHGGPPKKVYKCGCGELFSARQIRVHTCSLKPPRGQEVEASADERDRYLHGTVTYK